MGQAIAPPIVTELVLQQQDGHEFVMLLPIGVLMYWHHLSPLVAEGLAHAQGEVTPEDLRGLIYFILRETASKQILYAFCVEKVIYPRYQCVRVVAGAGQGVMRHLWALEAFYVWAKQMGARYVEGYARSAVVRLWKRLGASAPYYLVRKEL